MTPTNPMTVVAGATTDRAARGDANADPAPALDVSLIIPAKDEEATIQELVAGIVTAFEVIPDKSYEILLIDDGSRDRTWNVMRSCAASVPQVRAIRLRSNFGKATALATGAAASHGAIFITMDADLQDDPKEIPKFLEALEEGYDLVSGWKKIRHDPPSKTLPSKVFNGVLRAAFGVPLHDFNCGFKAARRDVYLGIPLHGELHRYVPAMASHQGFRIGEIVVEHHPRRAGKSKYGMERYVRGLVDLLTVIAITRYRWRPAHLFGGLGLIFGLIGAGIMAYLMVQWLSQVNMGGSTPVVLLGVLMIGLSIQLFSFGVLAEIMLVRTTKFSMDGVVAEER